VAAAPVSGPELASRFLTRYVASDGRVVRWDQGGDTVSEGQAYALLMDVATDDPTQFASVWTWERTNLQLPDGLFSYHWSGGQVVGAGAATDADLDTAWALVLAGTRFHEPSYRTAGLRVADAVLANETVTAGGTLVLVAGPWARSAPIAVDPSYFSPEAMAALATASGDPRWSELATDSQSVVAGLQGSGSAVLPPDWATVTAAGVPTPSGPPSTSQAPAYGLDAQRVPVWFAADCTAAGRSVAAAEWPTIRGLADGGADLAYSLSGQPETSAQNELGLVAASAAANAAGDPTAGATSMARARSLDHGQNYYGDAWVALGTLLLSTTLLSACPSA
jgi:endoglucanase